MKTIKSLEEYLNLSPLVIDTHSEVLDTKEKFTIQECLNSIMVLVKDEFIKNNIYIEVSKKEVAEPQETTEDVEKVEKELEEKKQKRLKGDGGLQKGLLN